MSARIHLVYSDLLYNCLTLGEQDARRLAHLYLPEPFQYPDPCNKEPKLSGYKCETRLLAFNLSGIRYASHVYSDFYFQGIRTIPSLVQKLIACEYLQDRYDLEGVPGFHYRAGWRLNLHGQGFLRPYRDELNKIIGLFVYQNTQTTPSLLSSMGLYKGAEAFQPLGYTGRELVA